jgi:hypothetical protein
MTSYSPIILFTYKRLDTLKQSVEALQKNYLAPESELIIFSDAAKDQKDYEAVQNVRDYIKTIKGFKSIAIHEASQNKGLANSIIQGVSMILENYDSVIVLEDDLVSSPNFLNYMNNALRFYKNQENLFSIAGYSLPIKCDSKIDIYYTQRASSWGWATWKDRWEIIDWTVSDYDTFKKDKSKRKLFNRMGSDMFSMLDKQMTGKLDSWAIRWCFSKIVNVGFTPDASNTKEKFNRFKTILDSGIQTDFSFSSEIRLDTKTIKQFVKPFTMASRIKYKILNLF